MGCCGGGGFGRMGGGLGRGMLRGGSMRGPGFMQSGASMEELDTEKILRVRLARGEITVEEYRQLRDALRETAS